MHIIQVTYITRLDSFSSGVISLSDGSAKCYYQDVETRQHYNTWLLNARDNASVPNTKYALYISATYADHLLTNAGFFCTCSHRKKKKLTARYKQNLYNPMMIEFPL